MVTRSVEGLHSQISRIIKRSPACKIPYISFELRAKQLADLAMFNPAEVCLQNGFGFGAVVGSGLTEALAVRSPGIAPTRDSADHGRRSTVGRIPQACAVQDLAPVCAQGF